jgi:RNA polymerase sigma-70 factor (ECF subfamily)
VSLVSSLSSALTTSGLGASAKPSGSGARSSEQRLADLLVGHFEMVWGALRRLGVAPGSVDDAAQEVFIIAARKLDTVESGRERSFLYAVALGVAANFRRAQRRSPEFSNEDALLATASDSPGAESLLEEKRLRELLEEILDRLTPDLRETFVLFELEGFSEREIGELCEIPLGTVASRLRRARAQFVEAAQRMKSRIFPRGRP